MDKYFVEPKRERPLGTTTTTTETGAATTTSNEIHPKANGNRYIIQQQEVKKTNYN